MPETMTDGEDREMDHKQPVMLVRRIWPENIQTLPTRGNTVQKSASYCLKYKEKVETLFADNFVLCGLPGLALQPGLLCQGLVVLSGGS